MQFARHLAVVATAGFALVACAQQEEPAPISAEPIYDKFGAASCPIDAPYTSTTQTGRLVCVPMCPDDQTGITTAAGQRLCVPQRCPPGQEPAQSTAAPGQYVCVPQRQGGDDPGGQTGGQPGTPSN